MTALQLQVKENRSDRLISAPRTIPGLKLLILLRSKIWSGEPFLAGRNMWFPKGETAVASAAQREQLSAAP